MHVVIGTEKLIRYQYYGNSGSSEELHNYNLNPFII